MGFGCVYDQTEYMITKPTRHQLVSVKTALLDTTGAELMLRFRPWSFKLRDAEFRLKETMPITA